ncbi:MAG TPA: ScpA family protein [Thermohalobaculum sp.]|nr:ScpA family protein [Thermohalobaculum sp.]
MESEVLEVSLGGYEGPLDLLLAMARTQKVDLRRISVLKLAEQYLAFVERADALRLELAADYLVMAAWLAYLKSRLLLPPPEDAGEASAEELAAHLAFQLERLEAMRKVAAELMARDRLGRDVFARGAPEARTVERRTRWTATLPELLGAYAAIRTRDDYRPLQVDRSWIFPVEEALTRIAGLAGRAMGWSRLSAFLPERWRGTPHERRSAVASSFAASLELVKRGEVEIRQDGVFAPIWLRGRGAGG